MMAGWGMETYLSDAAAVRFTANTLRVTLEFLLGWSTLTLVGAVTIIFHSWRSVSTMPAAVPRVPRGVATVATVAIVAFMAIIAAIISLVAAVTVRAVLVAAASWFIATTLLIG